jgi:hypothetical protein
MSFRTAKLNSGQKMLPSLIGKIQILTAIVLFSCLPSRANTITAASCSQTDVTTAINSASDGDTVQTPGNCTVSWSALTLPNTKNLTLSGQGTTTITSAKNAIVMQASASVAQRVTGFTFTGSGDVNLGDIEALGSSAGKTWRIDHNTFTNANPTVIVAWSNNPGLIDHNTFTLACGAEAIHNMAKGAGNNSGWQDDITPGGPNMLFIEDNTFSSPCSGGGQAVIEAYYGARTVFRYNSLYNEVYVDEHGTAGSVGARWYEMYDNTFYPSGHAIFATFQIRAGSGLIYNNHLVGSYSGNPSLEFWEEDSGTWPLAYQVGSGINGYTNQHSTCANGTLNTAPVHVWGNDAVITNATYGTPGSLIQQGRDFFIDSSQPAAIAQMEKSTDTCSTTYSYTPYPYPHPLQGQGQAQKPQPPTGLSAVVQ